VTVLDPAAAHVQLTLDVGGDPPSLSSFRISGSLDTLRTELPNGADVRVTVIDSDGEIIAAGFRTSTGRRVRPPPAEERAAMGGADPPDQDRRARMSGDPDGTEFEGWAIVEILGHRRLAGYVREVELAGTGMLRLDVPERPWEDIDPGEPFTDVHATQFYSPSALYCLTPTTEEIARGLAQRLQPSPVARWELPAAQATFPSRPDEYIEADEEDDEEEPF
jgi:hypothetical protein